MKDAKPLGFGWKHELKFCYAEFQYTTKTTVSGDEEHLVKNLTQQELNVIDYVRREGDKPEYDPGLRPVSFMMTQFHIIFVYPNNFTVLSSITQEIVYSRNFDKTKI